MRAGPECAYEFGEFRLVPQQKQLLYRATPVPLPPKVFDTLVLLVDRAGSLLEKDELLKRLWPDTFVEEVALAHNISLLRKAFRSVGAAGEFIETVPKRGYRFLPPVRELNPQSVPPSTAPSTTSDAPLAPHVRVNRRRLAFVAIAAAIGLAVVGIELGMWRMKSRSPSAIASIGILPFAVAPTDDAVAHLGTGLADALIVRLHDVPHLAVRPASAVASFDPEARAPTSFGKALGVETVLAGRIEHDGDRLRVDASLIRVSDDTVVWAAQFDEPPVNLLAVEDSIANRIVDSLSPSLNGEEHRRIMNSGTTVPAAHDAYLRGRYFWTRRSVDDLHKALGFHQEAVRLDPGYALAWAGLADAYLFLDGYVERSKDDMLSRARAAAAKAITLDPSIAQPHATLGLIAMNIEWNWPEAERQYREAIAIDPSYATAHAWLGEFLAYMGRFDEGIAELRHAHELDPLSPVIGSDVAKALTLARRYREALTQLDHMVETDPGFQRNYEYRCNTYFLAGRYDDAVAELERLQGKLDAATWLSSHVQINAAAGRLPEARAELQRLVALSQTTYVLPVLLALGYGAVGDLDNGFKSIDRMIADHGAGVIGFKVDPAWDRFRRDPRFDRVLARVGFPR